MLTENDLLLARLQRSARSISKLTTAMKVICVIMLVIAFCFFAYGLSRADRHTDDFVGFSCIGLAMTAFSLLFWSTAAFHSAVGESLAVVWAVHANLEMIRRAQYTPPQPVSAPPVQAPQPVPTAPLPEGSSAPAAALPEAAAATPVTAPEPAPAPAAAVVAAPRTRACRHCDGEIPIDASRCRHCFEVT